MWHIIIAVVLGIMSFAALVGLYIASVKTQARLEVKSQPRTAFFECPQHGVFQEKHLIHHLDQKLCPYCFNERVKTKLDGTMK
jgi:hypothetical protein